MRDTNITILILLPLIVFFSLNGQIFRFAEGGKRKIHITDDLDDVIDDEEDEAWKQWGKTPTAPSSDEFDPPPSDLTHMDISQIQELMMKQQHFGPVFGFVKLRLGVRRTPDMVAETAMKWTKVLRTGAVEVKFNGVDTSTIMFTMEKGQQAMELKEFILSEPEAYEIKIGDQIFRRPGDPPLDEVINKLRSKDKADGTSPSKDDEHPKDEL
ncbi:uncharacterized protein LOC8261898 [Ricinus communis]|uniref:Mesoderm development candidate 2 n=1 Tax=Ricinus communis TaxID=3988 RepID=B9RDU0_RICCO|nr:uncharacterized protein LOC8261898 [Ricinus communis]EEF50548.1 conserved hypothetical protein [Ricinus communis]|eukprot:XP_002511879.1 uncharacterized protein LOC8261898 [Ricinus communis]